MVMIVEISRALRDEIVARALASPEEEICGLLLGRDGLILEAVAVANVAADRARRFELDPQALFAAMRAERAGGLAMIGHYHSHPSGLAEPSACDAEAAEPGRLWLIVGTGEARLWRAVKGGAIHGMFEPVGLHLAR
jgi:desampylase